MATARPPAWIVPGLIIGDSQKPKVFVFSMLVMVMPSADTEESGALKELGEVKDQPSALLVKVKRAGSVGLVGTAVAEGDGVAVVGVADGVMLAVGDGLAVADGVSDAEGVGLGGIVDAVGDAVWVGASVGVGVCEAVAVGELVACVGVAVAVVVGDGASVAVGVAVAVAVPL